MSQAMLTDREVRVLKKWVRRIEFSLLGKSKLRSLLAEALPACRPSSSWAEGWIVEPKSNARLGLLPRRFRPVPLKQNEVEVRARGADLELVFDPLLDRLEAEAGVGEEAVLFVRPEKASGVESLDAFAALAAALWPPGLLARLGPPPIWDDPWHGPVDLTPMLLNPYHGRLLRLPFDALMKALRVAPSIRVTVGRESAPVLAERLAGALFVNGALIGNRVLERIEPTGIKEDIVLEGRSPLVMQCEDVTAQRTYLDERYAPPDTDPLRTFRIESSGRMVFLDERGAATRRMRVAYLRFLEWPEDLQVEPGAQLERDRVPVFQAVTRIVPDRSLSGGRDLREGAVWLLARPPVRYPSSDELRQAAFQILPAPLRAWVDLSLPAPAVRVEARRDARTGYAIPTWVIPLRPRPGAVAQRIELFFEGVAARLRDHFGELPIRLEWEGASDG
ncbi:MAG: hypothetical protein IPN34_17610 [Planctomycetes bacterium]|nr:hypothetical protein [Planctomycetota bacterium]